MAQEGISILKKYMTEYETLKEHDPGGQILNKYIEQYKRDLLSLLGFIPKNLSDPNSVAAGQLGPFTISNKKFGTLGLETYLLGSGAVARLFKKFNISKEDKSELFKGSQHYLNVNLLNENYPNEGRFIGGLQANSLNIQGYAYIVEGFVSRTLTINVMEIDEGNQGIQRGLLLAYVNANSELKKKKGEIGKYEEKTVEDYVQSAIQQDQSRSTSSSMDLGWAKVLDYDLSSGFISSVKIQLKDGRTTTYTKNTGNNALRNTLVDMIRNNAFEVAEHEDIARDTLSKIDQGSFDEVNEEVYGEGKTASLNIIKSLVKLANHLDSIDKIKESDYIDKVIRKYSSRLIDELTGSKEEHIMDTVEESEDVKDIHSDLEHDA